MYKIFLGMASTILVLEAVSHIWPAWRPDFDRAHRAFVCNYANTICRDRSSVLPVAWRRYAEVVKWEHAK